MRYFKVLSCFLFLSYSAAAQDSAKVKLLNNEVGINVISLVKQVVSNTPTNTLAQLPYDFFYNLYYRDMAGLRVGAGAQVANSKTEIDGQEYPRIVNSMQYNYRLGASYNIVRNKRIALNCFVDYVKGKTELETSNTSTVQSFPDPIQTITTNTRDLTLLSGAQLGFGVKFNFHKNLGIYMEVPYSFTEERTSSEIMLNEESEITESISSSTVYRTRVFLPTTIYLVLRF